MTDPTEELMSLTRDLRATTTALRSDFSPEVIARLTPAQRAVLRGHLRNLLEVVQRVGADIATHLATEDAGPTYRVGPIDARDSMTGSARYIIACDGKAVIKHNPNGTEQYMTYRTASRAGVALGAVKTALPHAVMLDRSRP